MQKHFQTAQRRREAHPLGTSFPVMMLTGFFCLLLITGGSTFNYSEQPEVQPVSNQDNEEDVVDSEGTCSYQDVLNHLNLTKSTELYSMTRPVKHHKSTTRVHLQMAIYGILDVREIDQTFVLYVWIYMSWGNDHIRWNQDKFCGLKHVVVPTEVLWKPDLTIEEMTEKDKAPPSPYLTVTHQGLIELRNDLMLVSTCRMQVYKFPFDIQSCNLSFKSAVYSDDEIKFAAILNASKFTEWSREVMRIQYEWLFLNMTVHEKTVNNLSYNQSMIVYTITMKRRSVLYIANFLLPIMFFLCLDLASFLISDSGGEKLGFKVTVLLAVTVMQLILNDILPSSSDRIPLIAVYCIGMFGLMMLSLLETILVMYLMGKDFPSQDNEADTNQSLSEDCGDKLGKVVLHNYDPEVNNSARCGCICEVSADEPPSDMLALDREGKSRRLAEESSGLEKILHELKGLEKTLNLLLNSRKEEGKPGYWTMVTKTINKVFFLFYVTVACLFLAVIFTMWINAPDE